jgi:hypothetical protein
MFTPSLTPLGSFHPQGTKFTPGGRLRPWGKSLPLGAKLRMGLYRLAAWSSGIVSTCHQGDWNYGLWDWIPPGYRLLASFYENKTHKLQQQFKSSESEPIFFENVGVLRIIVETLYIGKFNNACPAWIFKTLSCLVLRTANKNRQKVVSRRLWRSLNSNYNF